MSRNLEDATIAITGGTGSFGSTMVRYLLTKNVREVRIFSRDEAKQDLLRHSLSDGRAKFYIGDTRDFTSVKRATDGADLVFHAAALKQVPSAEFFPLEAVKTNVEGSANVIRASLENSVGAIVCLSTDKAVYPINAMGMSKALMERVAQSFARETGAGATTISLTRYGNVMYSRGSVIPLFISQLKSGQPITVTSPNMTRFLMSLQDSVRLVEYAFTHGSSGDLFVMKSPATTVWNLADALRRMFGSPNHEIRTLGFRHGEKLYESLLSVEERAKSEDLIDYFRVPIDDRGLDYSLYFSKGSEREAELEAYTSHNTERLEVEEVIQLLETVPEVQAELSGWNK